MTVITLYGTNEGITVAVPDTMTVAAIQQWLWEISEWLS